MPIAAADPGSPLTVKMTGAPNPVASGSQLTYTITTVNTAGSKVDNVVMTDQVNGVGVIQSPPALPQLVITSTKGSCTQGGPNGNVVSCNAGSLAGGETWTVTIRGQVTASNATTLNNTASVTGTKSAQNFTTAATTSVLVQNSGGGGQADLTLNKTGPSSVAVSSPITWTLTVNNIGTINATGVKVVDTVPTGVTGLSATGTSLFNCGVAGQTVTCTGGAVNTGANATITIKGTAPAAAGTITNTAVVDPDNTIAESNELNNTSATVNTSVGGTPAPPLLDIKKTDGNPAPSGSWWNGAGPDPVNPGQKITYKILVTNNAIGTNSRADDVVITDGTQGLDAASIIATQTIVNGTLGNGNGCVVSAPQIKCSVRSLNSGGTITVTITGTVLQSAGSTIFNTATVTGNVKNTGVSNTASEATTVRPAVDLTITKADNPDPVCARSWPGPDAPNLCQGGLKYTFVVGNSGNSAAANVVVRDVLPDGTIYDSFQNVGAADFSCPAGPLVNNELVCTNPSIAPASIESFSVIVVAPPSTGTISNTATVDPNNTIFESDETNNVASVTTQVSTGIDLVVYQFDKQGDTVDPPGLTPAYPGAPAGFDPIATNGTETYTVYVDNIGTQDATGIRVRDTLPADTKFLSATADHGFTCTQSSGVVECIGGHILGTESEAYDPLGSATPAGNDFATITIKIFATAYVQPAMHNEVRVDPLNEIAESNEQNNLAVQDTKVQNGDSTVGAFNELSIVKTQTDPTGNQVATSSTVTYQIVVSNTGTDPAVNVKVRDFLPSGFQFVEATDITGGPGGQSNFFCSQSGTVQSGIVVDCSGATLDGTLDQMGASVPQSRTIQIKASSASQPGNYTNQAIVDPDHQIPEGDETNNSSSVVTTVKVGTPQGFIDLTIANCDEPNPPANDNNCAVDSDPVPPLGDITYVLTVKNGGTDPAFNVTVRDVLPAGTSFVSAVDTVTGSGAFTCASDGVAISCTGGTLEGTVDLIGDPAVTQSRTIKIVLKAPNANTTVTNQAIVDPNNAIPESNEANNSATQTTTVSARRNLTVVETKGQDTAHQNDTPDYEITIRNDIVVDPGDAVTGVKVVDTLPIGLIPLSWNADGNFTCQIFENPVNYVECIGDLAPMKPADPSVKITIHTFVTATDGPLDNEACIDPANVFTESSESDNCKTKTTLVVVKSPDLFVQKSTDKTSVTPGELFNYTITVSNDGDASADAVTITDALDTSKLDFKSAIASNGFTCSFASPNLTCQRAGDGLAPGEFTTITLQVQAKPTASGTISNTASVPDSTPFDSAAPECAGSACANEAAPNTSSKNSDNKDTVTVSVGASGFDFAVVSLVDTPDPVAPGGIVTYTAVVANNGTSNATGVKVRTQLTPDAGITLTHVNSAGSNGFACTYAANVDCTGNLPAGGNTTITMQFQIAGTVPPDKKVSVTTTVDPDHLVAESDETNNSKSTDTTVHANCTGCKDLVAGDIVDSPDPVAKGSTVTYSVGIGNAGDQPADHFKVTLTLTDEADVDLSGFDNTNGGSSYSATSDFDCTASFNVVTCDGKNGLDAGEGLLITLKVPVKSTASHAFVNLEVKADSADDVTDEFSESNNTASESTALLP